MILYIFIIIFIAFFIYYNCNIECDNLYKPCSKLFLRQALYKNTVILSIVSKKYKIQIKNYWISSAVPNKLTNIVFIASDYSTYEFCKTFTKYVLMGRTNINQTENVKFMNLDFVKITLSRLEMIYKILTFGYTVLVNDIDIYLFQNPIPHILQYNEDIVSSVDIPTKINVGF